MMYFRMLMVALRLAWPHLLAPWRSPLLRWRMETYGCQAAGGRLLHAEEITPGRFWHFLRSNRPALARFLRWAALL
ncbi:MAG: hypothetical protein HY601_03855 [Candidatus Omnitrophica bacterium]|nr:hypothetical protein [Candidatus Omnitrophota bacterium]